ncbi:MAG TPA: hypothetical protein VFA63_09535 [Pseudonocardiaceae bacterium]|nr:hypothetical protein [Pseudonocardiaceae bacterium]
MRRNVPVGNRIAGHRRSRPTRRTIHHAPRPARRRAVGTLASHIHLYDLPTYQTGQHSLGLTTTTTHTTRDVPSRRATVRDVTSNEVMPTLSTHNINSD